MGDKRERRTYSGDQKAEAMRQYAETGPAAASKRLGIPVTTLTNWAKAAGVLAPINNQSRNLPAVQAAAAELQRRTEQLAAAMADPDSTHYDPDELERMWVIIARESFQSYRYALMGGDDMAAQRLNNCLGTATDKLQLLSGRPTSRREALTSPDEASSRVLGILDAIRSRKVPGLLDASSREVRRIGGDHVPELPAPDDVDDWEQSGPAAQYPGD